MACILLEDGTLFTGTPFGNFEERMGEVVFNTGMTGYQEVITDPSYCGQIVTMTYPMIGNYGVTEQDAESSRVQISGFLVHEICDTPSNWKCQGSLEAYCAKYGVGGLCDVDTRALVRYIRSHGTLRGVLCKDTPTDAQKAALLTFANAGTVAKVTCEKAFSVPGSGKRIAVLDFGAKQGIIAHLAARGCDLRVYPAHTTPEEILSHNPQGIMLTNGPGDPKDNPLYIETVKTLMNKLPVFGICLGHQLMALSQGADTTKLKYGHRGCNHPVKDLAKDRVYITSQNHGYTVIEGSLPKNAVVTHLNWNDKSIEGIRYNDRKAFSVQYHPEASPGPYDSGYLFDEFLDMITP